MRIVIINLQHKFKVPTQKIKSSAEKSARVLKLEHPEISIVFTGQQRMRAMNKKFLGHDYATDVITFNHGEIIICPSVALANAKIHKNTLERELLLYVIHGLLHLAGYDDHKPKDIALMRKKEQELL